MTTTEQTEATAPAAEQENLIRICAVGKVDLRGRFVYTDEHVEELLGLSQEELFGKSLKDFVAESQHELIDSLLVRHSRFETFFESAELTLFDSDGTAQPQLVTVSLNFVAGNPVNFQVIFQPMRGATVDLPTLAGAGVDSLAALGLADDQAALEEALERVRQHFRYVGLAIFSATSEGVAARAASGVLATDESPHASDAARSWIETISTSYEFVSAQFQEDGREDMTLGIVESASESDRRDFIVVALPEAHIAINNERESRKLLLLKQLMQRPDADSSGTAEVERASSFEGHTILPLELLSRAGVPAAEIRPDGSVVQINDALLALTGQAPPADSIQALLAGILTSAQQARAGSIAAALVDGSAQPETDSMFDTMLIDDIPATVRINPSADPATGYRIMSIHPAGDCTCAAIPLGKVYRMMLSRSSEALGQVHETAESLAHEKFSDLAATARIDLVSALEKIAEQRDLLTALETCVDRLSRPERPATVNLNLLAAELYERARSMAVGRQVNLSFGELPTVTAPRQRLSEILGVLIANLARVIRDDSVKMEMIAERRGQCDVLALICRQPTRELKNLREVLLDSDPLLEAGTPARGLGSLLVKMYLECIGATCRIITESSDEVKVELLLPAHGER